VPYLGAAFDAAIFVVLDWRLMRIGSATGSRRIVDHVWRMIAALLFATFARFIANPSVFPQWSTAAGFNCCCCSWCSCTGCWPPSADGGRAQDRAANKLQHEPTT
jgi:hypothetical protein